MPPSPRHLLLFFIDGFGIHPESNPYLELLARQTLPRTVYSEPFHSGDLLIIPTDAKLGVKGTPQSATGQTTIFSGVNAAEFLGYHLMAFPNSELIGLLKAHNIYSALKASGLTVAGGNLYSAGYFRKFTEHSVSTNALLVSGTEIRMAPPFQENRGAYMDITNEVISKREKDIPVITPEMAGKNIAGLLASVNFVFYEYFLTDVAGHKKDRVSLDLSFNNISAFLSTILSVIADPDYAVLLCSDHGNCEDLSDGGHTMNPVPVMIWNRDLSWMRSCEQGIHSIVDIHQAVESFYLS